ncbi:hypothetical protein OUZ56_008789 [Daphnia magna]|uniref:Uncharacterized protein n=1 Tax=Daphnia magna TaxID=35525 RepID=A0ABR0AE18_9CRUS|nr:hypothetical protein OUZ56_008789 [Daphnia magna]
MAHLWSLMHRPINCLETIIKPFRLRLDSYVTDWCTGTNEKHIRRAALQRSTLNCQPRLACHHICLGIKPLHFHLQRTDYSHLLFQPYTHLEPTNPREIKKLNTKKSPLAKQNLTITDLQTYGRGLCASPCIFIIGSHSSGDNVGLSETKDLKLAPFVLREISRRLVHKAARQTIGKGFNEVFKLTMKRLENEGKENNAGKKNEKNGNHNNKQDAVVPFSRCVCCNVVHPWVSNLNGSTE